MTFFYVISMLDTFDRIAKMLIMRFIFKSFFFLPFELYFLYIALLRLSDY